MLEILGLLFNLIEMILKIIIILALVLIFATWPVWLYFGVKYYRKSKVKKELGELKKEVTHYCPNCGRLIMSKEIPIKFCTVCGMKLVNALDKVELSPNLFKSLDVDDISKSNARTYYNDALKFSDKQDYNKYMELIKQAMQLGYAPAFYSLGCAYYNAKGVEKNNVLAQKYMEQAAEIGSAIAYRTITNLCVNNEFNWSKVVKNKEEGYFKAAVRGDVYSINKVLKEFGGMRSANGTQTDNSKEPYEECQRLWWAIRAAEKNDVNGIQVVLDSCKKMISLLSEYKGESEAHILIAKYNTLIKCWEDKQLHLEYSDEDSYNAYMAETKGEFEKALALYKKAAERNDTKAIQAVRRLTGDNSYKKVIPPKRYSHFFEQALTIVTHYCPNCGLLIYGKRSQVAECPLCGTSMLDGTLKEEFKKEYDSDLTLEENNYYLKYPEFLKAVESGDCSYIVDFANEHSQDGIPQYIIACMYDEEGKDKKYVEQLKIATELNSSEASYELGILYYKGRRGVEKNNVLAQKYIEKAAFLGCGKAYEFIVRACERQEFRWSQMVKNSEDGLFKAAIRGNVNAGFFICQEYDGNRKESILNLKNINVPSANVSKLWWMQRLAARGEADAVPYIRKYCKKLMDSLMEDRNNKEAVALYEKYDKVLKYWNEKELELIYRNPICYQAALLEKNNDTEKALEYYRKAAEKDGDWEAIVAVRRLTGNKNYMLKVGRLHSRDYKKLFVETKELFKSEMYELCLMQARKTLETYLHHLFFEMKIDVQERTSIYELMERLYDLNGVSEEKYRAMDFVRRKGNGAVHDVQEEAEEQARRVIEALTQIIDSDL